MHEITPKFVKPSWLEWFCLPVGLFLALHYAYLVDDAYVYFRYVDNTLFLKYGLVYNEGEYVEGYSSPLWCMLLLALRATTLNYWIIVRGIALVCYATFWYGLVVLNRAMSPTECRTVNAPLMLLGLNYGALTYFSSGLESPLVHLSALAFVWFLLSPANVAAQGLVALSPLVRHEFALPLAMAFVFLWIRTKRFPVRMMLLSALFTGSWLLFRIYYYADLFPNTFYLKDMIDVDQGLRYLHDTLHPYGAYFFGPAFILLGLFLRRRGQPLPSIAPRIMMLLMAAGVTAYVVKIGGDPRHFRYLMFPYVIAVCASGGLLETMVQRLPANRRTAAAPALAIVLALITLSLYPRQLSRHPVFRSADYHTVDKINDAASHRLNEVGDLTPAYWERGPDFNLARYSAFTETNLRPNYIGTIVGAWCLDLFNAFDHRIVHSLGLTEPVLARTIMEAGRPAHKYGLKPLAEDIAAILAYEGGSPAPGMYRRAVERDPSLHWIADNLATIEIVERKMLNEHRFIDNLKLAFTFPARIDPGKVYMRKEVVGVDLARNGGFESWGRGLPLSWHAKYPEMIAQSTNGAEDEFALQLTPNGQRAGVHQNLDLDERVLGGTLTVTADVLCPERGTVILTGSYVLNGETVLERVLNTIRADWGRLKLQLVIPDETDPDSINISIVLKDSAVAICIIDRVTAIVETESDSSV